MNLSEVIRRDSAAIAAGSAYAAGVAAQLRHFAAGVSTVHPNITVVFGDHTRIVTEDASGAVSETVAQVFAPLALWPASTPEPVVGDQLIVPAGPDAGTWRVRTVVKDAGAFVFEAVKHELRNQRGTGR